MQVTSYETQILKCLGKFKTVRDWPDLNGCLQSLLDTFQAYPDTFLIPHKLQMAKTLSQCLSPSLPSGINTKCLDVYRCIFDRIGPEHLYQDFHIWSPGLFQFFHLSGVSQRTLALKLFVDFFYPIAPTHPQIIPPILLAILPGIGDSGTDIVSQVKDMIDHLKNLLGDQLFWRAMFRAALIHPSTRFPFLIYANNCQPDSISKINSPPLEISTFTTLFHDSDTLVVRASLELFLSVFTYIDSIIASNLAIICVNLLESEDISIRRRVFNWITSYPTESQIALSKSTANAFKAAINKGQSIKELAMKALPLAIKRHNFEFKTLLDVLSPDELIQNVDPNDFETLLRLLSDCNPSTKTKIDLLFNVLSELSQIDINNIHEQISKSNSQSSNIDKSNVLHPSYFPTAIELSDKLFTLLGKNYSYDQKFKEVSVKVVELIFKKFRTNETFIDFATKIVIQLQLEPNLDDLVSNTPISYVCVKTLMNLSKNSLTALLLLDSISSSATLACWSSLKLDLNSKKELLLILDQLHDKYPSTYSIVISDHWDLDTLSVFIKNTKRIPICIMQIALTKQDSKSLELIASFSSKLIPSIIEALLNGENTRLLEFLSFYPYLFINQASIDNITNLASALLQNISSFLQSQQEIMTKTQSEKDSSSSIKLIKDNTKCLTILLDNNPQIRLALGKSIFALVYNYSSFTWCHPLLSSIYDQDLNFSIFLELIPQVPILSETIFTIIERNSSNFTLCEQFTTFLSNYVKTIDLNHEPSLFNILTRLFKLITQKCKNEVEKARNELKTISFKHFLTSVEELPNDNALASILLNYFTSDKDSIQCNFSSLSKKYLFSFIQAVFKDYGNPSLFYESFDGSWKLLCLYACLFLPIELLQNNNTSLLAPYIVLRTSEQLLEDVKNLITIMTYDEKIDRSRFCALIISLRSEPLLTTEGISLVSTIFSRLQIHPKDTIRLICEYSMASPNLYSLGSYFTSALLDPAAKGDVAVFEYLSTITSNVLTNVFGQKTLPSSLTKSFLAMTRSSYIFPRFIRSFCHVEADSLSWPEVLISFLEPNSFFSTLSSLSITTNTQTESFHHRDNKTFLIEVIGAINNVVRYSAKEFIPRFLESIMPSTTSSPKDIRSLKNLRMLSLCLFACDYDTFTPRVQFINIIVMHALSFEGQRSDILLFREFSLFMRILFIKTSTKIVESFMPSLHYYLISGLTSDDNELKEMATNLLKVALIAIPSSFQFTEFAFLPDTLTFTDLSQYSDLNWPLLKNDEDSNLHIAQGLFIKNEYEDSILLELSQSPF